MTYYTTHLNKQTEWSRFTLMALALCLPLGIAQAGELVLKGRNVGCIMQETWIPIGDDKRRGTGTKAIKGLSFLEDGRVATFTVKHTYESNTGLGTYQGDSTISFPNGSTITVKNVGTSKPIERETITLKGVFTVVGGTGEFEGINGEGTFAGTQYSNAMFVEDWEATTMVPD